MYFLVESLYSMCVACMCVLHVYCLTVLCTQLFRLGKCIREAIVLADVCMGCSSPRKIDIFLFERCLTGSLTLPEMETSEH